MEEIKRRKIDYLIKELHHLEKREIYYIIDLYGTRDFNCLSVKVLLNPDTDDPLLCLEKDRPNFFPTHIDIFNRINEFCTKSDYPPIFPHPEDVKESTIIRNELIKLYPESELNRYFNTTSFFTIISHQKLVKNSALIIIKSTN